MVTGSRNDTGDSEESDRTDAKKSAQEKSEGEELEGKMRRDNRGDKLAHTVLDADKDKIDKARTLTEALNSNISSFTPDTTFEQLVNNYRQAKNLLGETLIRELTGYEPGYVEKNVNVPEFRRELKERIKQNIDLLKNDGLLDKDGTITDEGYEFSALSMLSDEIDSLEGKGLLGEKVSKRRFIYGERQDSRHYRKGDRYKDIELKLTAKKAIRRGHSQILPDDLMVSQREATGKISIIYAIDSSGSMKGEKIRAAKRAGIALSYKALKNHDEAGLVVFGSKVQKSAAPSGDLKALLLELTKIKCSGETDIAICIDEAIRLFGSSKESKHLVLLTDALQTLGEEKKVLEKISVAADRDITISVIGISLNATGEKLAKRIVDVCHGTLHKIKSLEDLDVIILEDYYNAKSSW